MLQPFHLAIPVHSLSAAREFYGLFGCAEGRSSDEWVDFDFFGHQVVAHLDPGRKPRAPQQGGWPRRSRAAFWRRAGVAGAWQALAERLRRPARDSRSILASASRGRWASRRRCFSTIRPATRSSSRRSGSFAAVCEVGGASWRFAFNASTTRSAMMLWRMSPGSPSPSLSRYGWSCRSTRGK